MALTINYIFLAIEWGLATFLRFHGDITSGTYLLATMIFMIGNIIIASHRD